MFIDHKIEIHANLNETVIHGTLRPQDLVPAFLEVIKETPEYQQIMFQVNPPDYIRVLTDPTADENDPVWDSEEMAHFLNETLWDVLNSYAPDDYYFGCTEGNGSDFGYWEVIKLLTP